MRCYMLMRCLIASSLSNISFYENVLSYVRNITQFDLTQCFKLVVFFTLIVL